jgi:16S rRNA (uracil1498-N3)-methyltransferase
VSHRIIISPDQYPDQPPFVVGASISLTEDDSHYLNHVLRVKIGTSLTLIDPSRSLLGHAQVAQINKRVELTLISVEETHLLSSPVAALLYPLTKGDTVELVLEKGCELGVEHFILWQAERSVVRLENDRDQQKKLARWEKILRAAAQQSEKIAQPRISFSKTLADALSCMESNNKNSVCIQCALGTGIPSLAEILNKKQLYNIVVGPEGDFSPAENDLLKMRIDLQQASLGPYRLRAETAAITAVALVCGISGFSVQPKSL